jgi:hypothetical protein
MNKQYVHVARTYNIDMQHGEATWIGLDMHLGNAARSCSTDMHDGHAAKACSMEIKHDHEV